MWEGGRLSCLSQGAPGTYWGSGHHAVPVILGLGRGSRVHWVSAPPGHASHTSPTALDVFNQKLNKTKADRCAHVRIVTKHWRLSVKPAGGGEKGAKASEGCWALVHTRLPVLSPQPPALCSVVGMAST